MDHTFTMVSKMMQIPHWDIHTRQMMQKTFVFTLRGIMPGMDVSGVMQQREEVTKNEA